MAQDRRQELGGNLALQQALTVLREARGVPHRLVDPQPDKPAEQEIELDALDQLALRADRSLYQRHQQVVGAAAKLHRLAVCENFPSVRQDPETAELHDQRRPGPRSHTRNLIETVGKRLFFSKVAR
jgi:hypothetical protein